MAREKGTYHHTAKTKRKIGLSNAVVWEYELKNMGKLEKKINTFVGGVCG